MRDKIEKIINDWDPIGFFPMAPEDEYTDEISKIHEYIYSEKNQQLQFQQLQIRQIQALAETKSRAMHAGRKENIGAEKDIRNYGTNGL